MSPNEEISRRDGLKGLGVLGTAAFCGGVATGSTAGESTKIADPKSGTAIRDAVMGAPLIDTHEHLPDEQDCLQGPGGGPSEDWTVILRHYLDSDLRAAGMTQQEYARFFKEPLDPAAKWNVLAPYWPAVKNTGYGRAVRIAVEELYGISDLSASTVEAVADAYRKTRSPGFYRRILQEKAGIESCQVNTGTFRESKQPRFLFQDLSIVGMFAGPDLKSFGGPTGIEVRSLADWHRVIDWWFDKYARYAVAVKSQDAYRRNIDYQPTPPEQAEGPFAKHLRGDPLSLEERKTIEDHLFWYAVGKATEHNLPVKLHTGYYAGDNYMPLSRVARNAEAACDLCRASPTTRFVFMHICYPYYEDLISVAKHYTNAYVDMCWSWIINPVAAKDFLKKYLVTAPANKIFTFGGDYFVVEPVLGHAAIARRGIALALEELVQEGWISQEDALGLIPPVMHENAREFFRLKEKAQVLQSAPWAS